MGVRIAERWAVSNDFNSRRVFFETWGRNLGRCWAIGGTCSAPAVRAHSVQNARYMTLLARKGHVVELAPDFSNPVRKVAFREKGRHRATTFSGLCAQHDADIFRPIDTRKLNLSDREQLFLLAYRAVLREMQACAEVAMKTQSVYLAHVEAGLAPHDRPSPIGEAALERLIVAGETHLYKLAFDQAYAASEFSSVQHEIVTLDGIRPSIGASALLSFQDVTVEEDTVRAALTVLPLSENRTVVIFSFTDRDAAIARAELRPVLESRGLEQRHAISRRLLNSCENFVISPGFYDEWSEKKRDAVRNYFLTTLFRDDLSVSGNHISLFWRVSEGTRSVAP